MAFNQKLWVDAPNPLTPLSAAAMNDLEARIAAAATQADAFNLQPAVRATNSAAISVTGTTLQSLTFDTNRFDSDSQHYTSAANLTGTVAKTNGSNVLTGTTTLFTSQLSVGQVIDVPGGATERRVVTGITSDTSLTVNSNFGNTSSGQTATRVNSAITIRTAGVYVVHCGVSWAANATGRRQLAIIKNGVTLIDQVSMMGVSDVGSATHQTIPAPAYKFAQWDYVEAQASQNSGAALNINSTAEFTPEFSAVRIAAG